MRHEGRLRVAFVAGALTAALLGALVAAFTAYRVGPEAVGELGGRALGLPPDHPGEPASLPDELLPELIELGAVVDNAGNPTGQPDHDNMLVRPDAERGWVLRAGAGVVGHVLHSAIPMNLDPPVVYLPREATPSPELHAFLGKETRLRFEYTVDDDGFRRTLPEVRAERRVLVVGDSVAFGVGVGDGDTLVSALQALVGDDVQLVNAGVGEYGPHQILATAEQLAGQGSWEALVYVACQNDFDAPPGETYLNEARRTLRRLGPLSEPYAGRVLVVLQTALDYTGRGVIDDGAWPRFEFDEEQTTRLREELPALARGLGFAYRDWTDVVEKETERHRSLLHPFALYADHVHLSPLGNRLAAAQIHEVLREWGVAP